MATKRKRPSGTWEYVVRRKRVLPHTLYLTFETEQEGDRYVAHLEALLDKGIVPEEFKQARNAPITIVDAIRAYLAAQAVTASDRAALNILYERIGQTLLASVNYAWAETWISGMKREQQLSPTTIRHYVGALARCFDWAERHGVAALGPNPLRKLPRRYATYSEQDVKVVQALGHVPREDQERDRRLLAPEEQGIRAILAGEKPQGRQRPMERRWQGALECVFELALERAMRLREIYTLSVDQVDLPRSTIFLDKTKNGDKRQVPLTTIALKALKRYFTQVRKQERAMRGFAFENERIFPWWDGREASLGMTTSLLSRQFARIFEAAGCGDLRFHDLRHEATSRFFERTKLSDIQISRITGHKEPRVLRRYANLRGTDLASQLW